MDQTTDSGENRLENGQFAPGASGNPGGRPKGSISLVKILREKLEEIAPGQKKTYAERLVDKLLTTALSLNGDLRAIQDVIDRVDGKAVQSVITTKVDPNVILDKLDNDFDPGELEALEEQDLES